MSMSPAERALRARMGGLAVAAKHDARQYTKPARAAFMARFEHEVDPDRKLPAEERARRANAAMKLHMTRLSLKSARARKKAS